MRFGLWVELEMVNKDSELYRKHPDWILATPGRSQSHGRKQYVLDFSRKEVVDAVYEMIAKILAESSVSYIKWGYEPEYYRVFIPQSWRRNVRGRCSTVISWAFMIYTSG